jgi:hypothetical protein
MYNFSHSHVIRYEINHLLIINLFIFVRGKDIASVAKTDRIIRTQEINFRFHEPSNLCLHQTFTCEDLAEASRHFQL